MILYHGSNVEVKKPKILNVRRGLDFGAGFYATSDLQQAQRWAKLTTNRRRTGAPTVSAYDFDYKNASQEIKVIAFDKPNKDWLEFVSANRTCQYTGEKFDLVIGPVANDKTILTINDYISGAISSETALILLEPTKLSDQYAFLTHKALSFLRCEGVEYYA